MGVVVKNQQCEYLGVNDCGCVCQTRCIILLVGGKVEDYVITSKHPVVAIKGCKGECMEVECDFVFENLGYLDYKCKPDLEKLKEGWYKIIMESGCWTSYDWYSGAHEGDGDTVIKVVKTSSEEEFKEYENKKGIEEIEKEL